MWWVVFKWQVGHSHVMNSNEISGIRIAWIFKPSYCIISLLLINDKQIYNCNSFCTVPCHFWVKLICEIYCKFLSCSWDCCDSNFIKSSLNMNVQNISRIWIAWIFIPLYCIVSLLLLMIRKYTTATPNCTVLCHF